MGDIDIGGLRRFGPQSSATCGSRRTCSAGRAISCRRADARPQGRGAGRALPGQHGQSHVQPGHLHLRGPSAFLTNRAASFVGLTPEAQFDRWRFALFGFYLQDDFQISPRVTLNAGLRYEFRPWRARSTTAIGAAGSQRLDAGRRPALREPHLHQPVTAARPGGTSSQRAESRCAPATGSTSTPTTTRT